jgi:hypothetical protein
MGCNHDCFVHLLEGASWFEYSTVRGRGRLAERLSAASGIPDLRPVLLWARSFEVTCHCSSKRIQCVMAECC